MKLKASLLLLTLTLLAASHMGMGSRGGYDEEAREMERQERAARKAERAEGRKNPVREFAGGVKQATYDSTSGFISDTADGADEAAGLGTLEGARTGTGKVLDNTVKGVAKVATLGYGSVDSYEVQEPEKGSDEPTKIRIKIPGT